LKSHSTVFYPVFPNIVSIFSQVRARLCIGNKLILYPVFDHIIIFTGSCQAPYRLYGLEFEKNELSDANLAKIVELLTEKEIQVRSLLIEFVTIN
jgi:hypothetical protein